MVAADSRRYDVSRARELFEKFIKDYHRSYLDGPDKEQHFAAFKKNLEEINRLNALNPSAAFDINQFSDNTEEEINRIH